MNKVILMGRLTRDPDVRYSAGESGTSVARYTLAVDRRFNKRDGEATADFISCVAFGRSAEFAEKYFHQGLKVVVTGRIQTGSYTNRDGNKGLHYRCSSRGIRSLLKAKLRLRQMEITIHLQDRNRVQPAAMDL